MNTDQKRTKEQELGVRRQGQEFIASSQYRQWPLDLGRVAARCRGLTRMNTDQKRTKEQELGVRRQGQEFIASSQYRQCHWTLDELRRGAAD